MAIPIQVNTSAAISSCLRKKKKGVSIFNTKLPHFKRNPSIHAEHNANTSMTHLLHTWSFHYYLHNYWWFGGYKNTYPGISCLHSSQQSNWLVVQWALEGPETRTLSACPTENSVLSQHWILIAKSPLQTWAWSRCKVAPGNHKMKPWVCYLHWQIFTTFQTT